MNPGGWLALAILGVASSARAGDRPIDGHVAVGGRSITTETSDYNTPSDRTPTARVVFDAMVGYPIGSVIVGVHAASSPTPLRYFTRPQLPPTYSTIYPLDLGIGVELAAQSGFRATLWVGTTLDFAHAHSPAAHIDATDFKGDIAAASWSDRTANLGFGIACGHDIFVTRYGRWAALVAFDYEGLGKIPSRRDNGDTYPSHDAKGLGFSVLMAYRY